MDRLGTINGNCIFYGTPDLYWFLYFVICWFHKDVSNQNQNWWIQYGLDVCGFISFVWKQEFSTIADTEVCYIWAKNVVRH